VIAMVCQTLKTGTDCTFMSPKGCSFNGGACYPIIESCQGCDRVKEFDAGPYCISYPNPSLKWKMGACNFATHIKAKAPVQNATKVNPLKASKRSAR
jgi:Family of unknown function (DUF6811)